MLDETRTRQKRTQERDVLSTDSIGEAGLAITGVMEGGIMKSRRSDGTANTIFQGVSWITNSRGSVSVPQLVQLKAGAPDSGGAGFAMVQLPYKVTDPNDVLLLLGSGYGQGAPLAAVSKANLDTATEYNLDDTDKRTILVTNANANQKLFASYSYTPTEQQKFLEYGDNYLPKSSLQMNRIGLILTGTVYTSNYDTTVDWSTVDTVSAQEVLVAGVNGKFTVNKTGAICSKCYVIEAPKPGSEYLGIYIDV